MSGGSTTRISTNLEQLWRNQFFALQERTAADGLASLETGAPQKQVRQMTDTVRFAGGVYDPAIISFYEGIIVELQREVARYKSLWAAALKSAQAEAPEEAYVPRQTVPVSPAMARKLRGGTRPGLRASTE